MSIWSSVGPVAAALNGSDEAANYRCEGTPNIEVDVATTVHEGIRLALWSLPFGEKDAINVNAILVPEMAARLRDNLTEALERKDREDASWAARQRATGEAL